MPLTLDESVRELEKRAATLDVFEMTVLLKSSGLICEARVNASRNIAKLFLKKPDGDSAEVIVTDITAALRRAGIFCGNGHLLIDTLTVRTKPLGSTDEYLNSDDELYLVVQAAWVTAFTKLIPAVRSSNIARNQEVAITFAKELLRLDKFQTNIWVKLQGALREAELTFSSNNGIGVIHLYLRNSPHVYDGVHHRAQDISSALTALSHFLDGGELFLDTLLVKTNWHREASIANDMIETSDPLYELTRGFWSAAMGIDSPSPGEDSFDPLKIREKTLRETFCSYLASGKRGVQLWNAAPDIEKSLGTFENIDLEKCELTGIKIGELNFKTSNFTSARLKKLNAKNTDFTEARFTGADLSDSRLLGISARGADFSKAILRNAKLHKADLRDANFADADVSDTDFKESDLCGVDLTSCNVSEALGFLKAKYDDDTRLPADFSRLSELQWKGNGADPYLLILMANQKAADPIVVDFTSFLGFLGSRFDEAKVSKSLSMLKKESFQLFSEQTEAGILGIIKSQTDPDLVYACKLGCEGSFSCCTQNLNQCGGLQGAICKHIYVLVIGLAKNGEVDPAEVLQCLLASKRLSPQLNKEVMTSLFLRFKGAQNGELDWRTTETIPEDYYSF